MTSSGLPPTPRFLLPTLCAAFVGMFLSTACSVGSRGGTSVGQPTPTLQATQPPPQPSAVATLLAPTPFPTVTVPASTVYLECEAPARIPCEDRVVRRAVAIPGTDLRLQYASDRVPGPSGQGFDSRVLGLGGWTLDILDVYQPSGHRLLVGDEPSREVDAVVPTAGPTAGNLLVASPDALEVSEFDPTGRHIATRDALTGAVLRRFTYDADGRLVSVTDAAGGETRIERDAQGAPQAIVGPTGLRTQLRVTPEGYLDQITSQSRPPTSLTVRPDGLVTELIDAAGDRYRFEYDADGLLARYTDPAGGVTTLAPLPSAGVVVTSPLGRNWTYRSERQPDGSLHRSLVGPAGDTTDLVLAPDDTVTIVYPSGLRRVERRTADPRWALQAPTMTSLEMTTPAGLRWQQAASLTATLGNPGDPFSLITLDAERVAAGSSFRRTFDATSNTITTTGPDGRTDRLVLDDAGRIVSSQRGDLVTLLYAYDDQGRLASAAIGDPAARAFQWTYSEGLGLVSIRNPLGDVSRVQYDAGGAPSWYAMGDGAAVSVRLDGLGRLISISPPGHAAYRLRRSPIGIVTILEPPTREGESAAAPIARSLDADGWLTHLSGPMGPMAVLAYDDAGRLVSVETGDRIVTAAYEGASTRLQSLSGPAGETVTYSWDGPILVAERWAGPIAGSVERTFDDAFRIVRQSVNGGSEVAFAYDERERAVSAGALTLEYGGLERPTETRIGDLVETWSYDALGSQTAVRVTVGDRVVYEEANERDALGRVTRQTTSLDGFVADAQFGYDAAGRLSSAQVGGQAMSYAYDLAGNRVTTTDSAGSVTSTFDDLDRLLSMGDTRYAYDDAGKLVRAEGPEGTTAYRYDTLGRLLGADLPDGRSVEYLLDGLGRRVGVLDDGVLVRGFLYADELRPIAELDGSGGVVSRFVYSAAGRVPEYMVREGRTYALITDQIESVRAVIDTATGVVAQRIEYDPFGRVLVDTTPGFQPFGFAGGLADPLTGLVHFGAREYDPRSGRFTTPDPIDFAGGDTNLYRYAQGDTVNRTDPTGLDDPCTSDNPGFGDSPGGGPPPDTFGFSFGVTAGVGAPVLSAGWNVQYFPGHGWAVFNYAPVLDNPDQKGFAFGAGGSVNIGWHQGDKSDTSPGSWKGDFNSYGLAGGPLSYEAFESSPKEPGWCGRSIGLGPGLPAIYRTTTNYQCVIGCGAANGDPHVRTGDGLAYEFQAAGEFVAVDGGPDDLVVQIRTEPYGTSTVVSIITAIALDVAGDRVSFYSGDATEVHVAGQPIQVTIPVTLPQGGQLERTDAGYRVTWPDGSRVEVGAFLGQALDLVVDLATARRDAVHGLLGDQDDVYENDLATRDGQVLTLPDLHDPRYAEVVYGTFAESWRITAEESLFDYPPGATTETYTRRDFPARVVATDTLTPDVRASAETICRRAGVNAQPFLDACIIDVGLTGDAGFAESAARGQGQTIPPTATRTYPIELGEVVGPDRPIEGAGRLGAADEVDEYPFPAQAGRSWYLAAAPTCTDSGLVWSLIGPDGTPIDDRFSATQEALCVDLGRFTALATGTYVVRVRAAPGTAATGEYGFQLIPVPADVRTTIAFGDTVSADNPVPGAGRLSSPGAVHSFLFTAAAGDAVYIETAGCDQGALVWRLFGTDGEPIPPRQETCLDLGRFDLPSSGAYTIAVGEGGPETGTYGFTLIRVGPDGAFAVQPGDTISLDVPGPGAGRIETPGSNDRYTFAVTAGDRISVESLVSGAASCSDLRWDLLDSDGSGLYTDQILCAGAERPAVTAPTSGTYTLLVRGYGAAVGTYGMRVTVTR